MENQPRYWFAAKTYGWGWGLPLTWEGWVVFLTFFALLTLVVLLFPADRDPIRFTGCIALLTMMLVLICYAKGEPPRWRWGGR